MSTESTASVVRRRVMRAGRNRFWHASDFEGPRTAVEKALGRLVADGELLGVRNGLYWRGVETPLGMAPPNPRVVLSEVARGHAVGPAGLSAGKVFGLTTQVPRIPCYAVSGWKGRDVPRIRTARRDGARGHARDKAGLTAREVAFLEVLEAWDLVVELSSEEAVARLVRALVDKEVRPERLAAAAEGEPATVRERLRALLSRSGYRELGEPIREASKPAIRSRALEPLGIAA